MCQTLQGRPSVSLGVPCSVLGDGRDALEGVVMWRLISKVSSEVSGNIGARFESSIASSCGNHVSRSQRQLLRLQVVVS